MVSLLEYLPIITSGLLALPLNTNSSPWPQESKTAKRVSDLRQND